jgi:dTDP-4-dehydrorhamnose reductase
LINCYIKIGNRLNVVEGIESLVSNEDKNSVIWIDMLLPTIEEIRAVEKMFDMNFPTKQESEEIELSSRYWEENNRIEINSYFLINDNNSPFNETVSFILQGNLLISVRYKKLESFNTFTKKLLISPREFKTGYSIFCQIIDIRIDADADLVNRKAVKKLALVSQELEIKLIHISTDYVFDGKNFKPYCEQYITNPQGVYGKTKLDGENEMIKINPKNSIIIRTSWVYSSFGNNFVKTMLRLGKEKESLGVIFDQVGTPTYAKDLAKTILDIIPQINNDKVEIYNYSNEGVLSWYDFAKEIMKMAKLDCKINPIETFQYPTPARRPHFSLSNKSKIKSTFGIEIPFWKDSLDECLKILRERK